MTTPDKKKDFYDYLQEEHGLVYSLDLCLRGAARRMREGETDMERAVGSALEHVRNETTNAWRKGDTTWLQKTTEIIPVCAKRELSSDLNHAWLEKRLLDEIRATWNALAASEKAKTTIIANNSTAANTAMNIIVLESEKPLAIDSWTRAIRTLPTGVGGKIGKMMETKGRDFETVKKAIDSAKKTSQELGFVTPDTSWTWQLQKIVDDNHWLKDIDAILKQEGLDISDRGTFWKNLLVK